MAYRRTERVMRRLQARHDAIVAAAQSLASQHGMEAVQIAPVARRAGIAAGTVYRYFPSKVQLVGALAATISARELAAMRHAAESAPGPLSALAAVLATFAARAAQDRQLTWALLAEPVDAELDRVRRDYRAAIVAEVAAWLRPALADIHTADGDAMLLAPAIVGALLEALLGPLAPATGDDLSKMRAAVQMLTLFALRGLGILDARARGLVVQTVLPVHTPDV